MFSAGRLKSDPPGEPQVCFLPGPFDEVGQVVEEAEGVEGVTDDLCDGPCCDEEQHAVLTLHLQEEEEVQQEEEEQEEEEEQQGEDQEQEEEVPCHLLPPDSLLSAVRS